GSGIETFVTFHSTQHLESDGMATREQLVTALRTCTRVFVHNLDDVNRLRERGLVENVVLLAHGVINREPMDPSAVRSLLGLSRFSPVIGTFGFLLPGKGLTELIHSFAMILRAHPSAYMLMVNAEYPSKESREERRQCIALTELLELQDRVRLIDKFL